MGHEEWGNVVRAFSIKLNENIKITDTSYFENTCKVIFQESRPGSFDKKGKIVLLPGQTEPRSIVIVRPIFDSNGKVDYTSASTEYNLPLGDPQTGDYLEVHTDNHIVRLSSGSLLANKACSNFKPVQNPKSWQNILMYDKKDPNNPKKALRGSQPIWSSTDGVSWNIRGIADPYVFGDGEYGYPLPMGCLDSEGKRDVKEKVDDRCQDPNHPEYSWGGASFDRQELYSCPFTGYLYLTSRFKIGPYKDSQTPETKKIRGMILLCSKDKGITWHVVKEDFPDQAPLVMTSTPNGRLFLYQWNGTGGRVYFSNLFTKPNLPTISEGREIKQEIWGGNANQWNDSGVDYLGQIKHPCISRISTDTKSNKVRVSHVVLNEHGRQALKILNLELKTTPSDVLPDGMITVSVAATLQPKHLDTHSMTLATFIDPDYVNFPSGFTSNTAMLYWLEYPSDELISPAERVYARYQMFKDDKAFGPPSYLSVQNGQPRSWDYRKPAGHYLTGGFFFHQNSMNYLAQWREPDGIKANIVTVKL